MPRYDVPKAAPEPLRQVQLLSTAPIVENAARLARRDWLAEHGLAGEVERARALREALRALVLANNGVPLDAARARDGRTRRRSARRSRVDDAGTVSLRRATATRSTRSSRSRSARCSTAAGGGLKACRNCRWSFYDYSPNRSATWCSMQLCGNRTKTRAYRSAAARHVVGSRACVSRAALGGFALAFTPGFNVANVGAVADACLARTASASASSGSSRPRSFV